ncbi:MAG TPA: mechanosensitive ion channel family protein [Candidatus Limnocylindrales bacterium]
MAQFALTFTPPWGGQPVDLGDNLKAAAAVLAIVVVAAVVIRLAHVFVGGIARALLNRENLEGTAQELSSVELKKRTDTIETLGVNVIRFFVVVIAGLMILHAGFNLDIGPAVAGLGIAGIAIGLGTQNLVRDYLNGALILIENQYARGDVVRIAGVSGKVEDFTLRRTTLRDQDGTVHTVPNGEITVASNLTRIWARVNQDVQVVYGTDIERATSVVDRVGQLLLADPEWGPRILAAPAVERVSALGELGVTLKVVGTVRAAEQWAVGGELRKRLLAAFAESGIEIPQPQRVVLTQPGRDGAALPVDQKPAPDRDDIDKG